MPSVKIIIDVEVDGHKVPGFPIARRTEVTEVQQFNVTRATGGGFVATPTTEIPSIKALILHTDEAVTVRLDGQSDAGIELNAGGILVILDTTINDGASTNATISNASGNDAQIEGIAAG